MNDIPERVAVLEQLARSTDARLSEMQSDMREIRRDMRSEFRWMLGIMLGGFAMTLTGFAGMLAVMAHGFHWL